MFKNRNLNISFLFSIGWHLFWLSAICIVVMPTVKLQDNFTDVNFLGPILEKTAFDIMVEDATPFTETRYHTSAILENEVHLDVKGPQRLIKKNRFPDKDKMRLYEKLQVSTKKESPYYFMEGKKIFYHQDEKVFNRFIEGPAKSRAILFRPQLPVFPKSLYRDEENFITKLKFTLSKEGNVIGVEPVTSSGYPVIDLKCIGYIKQWRFAPQIDSDRQWGIITLNIKTE